MKLNLCTISLKINLKIIKKKINLQKFFLKLIRKIKLNIIPKYLAYKIKITLELKMKNRIAVI